MGKKKTIDDCHKVATERGGKCLSTEYFGCKTKYEWECAKSHRWMSALDPITNGNSWCPYCAGRPILTIDDCHKLAESKGGKFLSIKYINNQTKYEWECNKGHQWKAKYSNVKTGNWCPYCVGKYKTIKDCYILAEKRGGKFLSTEYINSSTKYLWECAEGHRWMALFSGVMSGYWCPKCVKYTKGQDILTEFCKTINPNFVANSSPFCKPNHRLQLDIHYVYLGRAIELDGDFWHNKPGRPERDARKNKLCDENQIKLLRLDYDKHWAKHKRNIGQQMIIDFIGGL